MILSLILGLLFWVPVFGVLIGGLAIIYSIKSFIENDEHLIPSISILLGAMGVFQPVLLMIFSVITGFSGLAKFLFTLGYGDLVIPIHVFTMIFFSPIFLILFFFKVSRFKVSIISLVLSFIIAVALTLPHVMAIYPSGFDAVEILNALLPVL